MTQVEPSATMIVFSSTPGDSADGRKEQDEETTRDYFRHRESAERAAAKKATSSCARSIHQELAQNYAALSRRSGI